MNEPRFDAADPFRRARRAPACEAIADRLPLLHDRELGPAETARVEAHLAVCAACQAEADGYARLSSALKQRDASDLVVPLPAEERLARTVLARIAPIAVARRRERRLVRRVGVAWAASVLGVLGVSGLLGRLATTSAPDSAPGPGAMVVARDPEPAAAALDDLRTRVVTTTAAPSLHLAPIEVGPPLAPRPLVGTRTWDPPRHGGGALLAEIELVRREVERRSARVGEPVVAYAIPGAAARARWPVRYLPLRTWKHLEASGWLAMAQARGRGFEHGSPTQAGPSGSVPSGHPREVFERALAGATHDGPTFSQQPGSAGLLETRVWRAAANAVRALDPLDEVARGHLSFAEAEASEKDIVVARVGPTTAPMLLLDGQLIVGGRFDRVVAEATWLPASSEPRTFVVPCQRVTWGPPRNAAESAPRLTSLIAGPSLRALLREGADTVTILEHVQSLVQAADPVEFAARRVRGGSLVDAFESLRPWRGTGGSRQAWTFRDHVVAAEAEIASSLERAGVGGFEAVQRTPGLDDAWLGVEDIAIGGDVGARALARLHLGYELEAWLGWKALLMAERVGSGSRPTPIPARAARDAMANSAVPLVAPREGATALGTARGEIDAGPAGGRVAIRALPAAQPGGSSTHASAVALTWRR